MKSKVTSMSFETYSHVLPGVDGQAVAWTESPLLGNDVNGVSVALYKPIGTTQLQEVG